MGRKKKYQEVKHRFIHLAERDPLRKDWDIFDLVVTKTGGLRADGSREMHEYVALSAISKEEAEEIRSLMEVVLEGKGLDKTYCH